MRARVASICSIHEAAETLTSDILAKFPALSKIALNFQPHLPHINDNENLIVAECTFHKWHTPVGHPLYERNDLYSIKTQWRLPISPLPGYMVSIFIITEERPASTAHHQISSFRKMPFRPSLDSVHPTFGLHKQVASIAAGELQSGNAEGAALYLAQCLFYIADEQSPCKRIQRVTVKMRDGLHLSDAVQSQTSKVRETREGPFINKAFTVCSVRLDRRHYEQSQCSLLSKDSQSGRHQAFLALGSNLGNRVEMIESAVREMGSRGLSVSRTSALYETKPMYLENQESFMNGACEVCSTDISHL